MRKVKPHAPSPLVAPASAGTTGGVASHDTALTNGTSGSAALPEALLVLIRALARQAVTDALRIAPADAAAGAAPIIAEDV